MIIGDKVKRATQFRKDVLARDNHTCQHCGAKSRLEVHHIKDKVLFPELACDVNNGLTLCRKCHRQIPPQKPKVIRDFQVEYYTIPEVAERLHIHPETTRRLLIKGKLGGIKIGDSWRIPKSSIEKYSK